MSLHTLANHLQSAGRGEDKVLVHMTPREVQSLQTLAMAHGGSLTINPQTGLPEAGFLSSLLPMIAGAFLGPGGMMGAQGLTFGGLSSAASVGLLGAGIGTLATGSLGKGLMMGLGAYGGAGLSPGLFGAGAATQAANAVPAATAIKDVANPATLGQTYGSGAMQAGTMPQQVMATSPFNVQGFRPGTLSQVGSPQEAVAKQVVQSSASSPNAGSTAAAPVQTAVQQPSMFDRFTQGAGKFFGGGQEGEEYRKDFLSKYGMPLAASGAAMYMLSKDDQRQPNLMQRGEPITPSRTYTGEYTASATPGLTGERRYTFLAEGGLADLPVERMSQQASTGANTNYPMANIRPFGYAVPRNEPVSENVFKPMDYQRTDPYTGEQKFAEGGIASLATGGFVSKLKVVEKPKETKPKLKSTSSLDKTISSLEKYSDLAGYQNQISDLESQLAELNKNKKANKTPIADANKELKTAKAGLKKAKEYQSAVKSRDKIVADNEAATAKAQATYNAAMDKYNQYQDALAAEKQTWQEQTARKSTGIQSLRAEAYESPEKIQEKIRALEEQRLNLLTSNKPTKDVDKQIADLNKQLKTAGQYKPVTSTKYSKTKRLMEESDIVALYEDMAGRRPTTEEINKFLGTKTSDSAIADYIKKLPDVTAKMSYTDDDLRENWMYYNGREPTSGEMAAMKKAKLTNFNELRAFIKSQPAYLENVNRLGQQSIQALATKSAALPIETIASTFRDVLGRQPTVQELDQYSKGYTSQSLADTLKQTEDYKNRFVQGIAPKSYLQTGKYAPGTVLEYTPENLQTSLQKLAPTASGLQTPQAANRIIVPGAYPLNPTFQEQLGLQTLASQAAQVAPPLQQGLRFDVPAAAPAQGQLMPGLTGLTQPLQQQGYEQQLANIGEKQIQPAAQPVPQPVPVNEAGIPVTALANTAPVTTMAMGGYAGGGYHLGDYSDGGRLLKGPGDGVSDSIPASIGNRQPARLADGEFVIPARIVSEIGNGSTDAGARKLYAMMDRIQRARRKSIGKGRVAVDSKAEKLLPA